MKTFKCFGDRSPLNYFIFSLTSQKGIALLTVYFGVLVIMAIGGAAYTRALYEMRHVERELNQFQSAATAEAGLQAAMVQIGQNGYTGFINTNPIPTTNIQDVSGGVLKGSFSATITYPNQADWVIINATGTSGGVTRQLEARVFLQSNFSKYLVYANTADFNSGAGAQYGEADLTDLDLDSQPDYPKRVSPNEDDRASLYFTGDWNLTEAGVLLYGDANAQGTINGNSQSYVNGDTYAGAFTMNSSGQVTNSGVTGGLKVGDGFSDDIDRNRDGAVQANDYPDYHDLTATGEGDAHATEQLVQINDAFYSAHNNTPGFVGATSRTRYLAFEPSLDGTSTKMVEYSSAAYSTVSSTQTLPTNAVVYVKGSAYVKGEIQGRVSVVTSGDIYFAGNVAYTGNQKKADETHSAAFLASNKLYFLPDSLEVSGILYAENTGRDSAAFDAGLTYNVARNRLESDTSKTNLKLYGNRVINGGTNLSYYNTRLYGYDKNLKYFRPPGIPIFPALRSIREIGVPTQGETS